MASVTPGRWARSVLQALWLNAGRFRLSGTLKVSISLFPILLAAVLFGPLAAMLVSVSSMLGEERTPRTRWVCYASSRSLTGAVAGLVAIELSHSTLPSILAASAAAACCTQFLDLAFAAVAFTLRGHGSPLNVVRTLGPLSLSLRCRCTSRAWRSWRWVMKRLPLDSSFVSCSGSCGTEVVRPLPGGEEGWQLIWRRRTSNLSGPTSRSPQLSSPRSTREIATPPATRRQ